MSIESFAKRALDIFVSALGLLLLVPVFLILAVLVFFKIGWPVIFAQERPGLHGRPFRLYKFRSMSDLRDAEGNLLSDDRRLLPFGSFLRRWSLDELPELWNVVRGDMSLVGPRPLLMEYLPRYSPEEARRHETKPGITGWAQIHGRNAVSWEDRFRLDVWYVDHRTFWLDLRILARTLFHTIRRAGISAEGHATMPKFQGSEKRPPD